jgi:hypothetical protein
VGRNRSSTVTYPDNSASVRTKQNRVAERKALDQVDGGSRRAGKGSTDC